MVSLKGQTDMLSIQVREGRFPQNEDEIALPKSELERWGYDKNINQNIELGYISRNGSYKKTYHVVGLLEEAKEGFESSAVIQSKEDYTYGSVYIGNDVKVDNSEEIGLIQDMTFEEFQLTGPLRPAFWSGASSWASDLKLPVEDLILRASFSFYL